MPLKWRKRTILAKTESSYGQDATPTGTANAILVSELTITPLEGETVQRDLVRPYLGNEQQIHVGTHVSVEFMVEVAGAGVAGDPPAYAPLLTACGLAETIDAGIDVQYDPVSANEASASLYVTVDNALHKMLGARGSVALQLDANGIPHYRFRFLGLWVDPAQAAPPATDFSAFQEPLPASSANTPAFTLHGVSAALRALTLDLAVDVQHRALVGSERVEITDRRPGGSITIEAPDLASHNHFTAARNSPRN